MKKRKHKRKWMFKNLKVKKWNKKRTGNFAKTYLYFILYSTRKRWLIPSLFLLTLTVNFASCANVVKVNKDIKNVM